MEKPEAGQQPGKQTILFSPNFASPGHGVFPFATKGSARLLMSSVEKESPRSRALPAIVELAIVGGRDSLQGTPDHMGGLCLKKVSKSYQ